MKTLLVLRHAKASQEAPSNMDFDRPLKRRGRAQALAIGGMVRDRHLAFDAIVASPAVRVVETLSGIMEGAGVRFEPTYDRRLYNASPETVLEIVREAGDTVERLLIVGHNPGLQHLLLHVADEDRDGLREAIAASYPTAALAELQLSVDRWRDIDRARGQIVRLVRPED